MPSFIVPSIPVAHSHESEHLYYCPDQQERIRPPEGYTTISTKVHDFTLFKHEIIHLPYTFTSNKNKEHGKKVA